MTTSEPDPRVFFASERTLLAWVRTGLAIIGLGYVVARFGLFLRIMARESGQAATISHNLVSRLIGVAFVVVGAVSMVMASVQHRAFVKALPIKDLPTNYYRGLADGLDRSRGDPDLGSGGGEARDGRRARPGVPAAVFLGHGRRSVGCGNLGERLWRTCHVST